MKKNIILIFFILLLPLAIDASAHQPRFIVGEQNSVSNPILVEQPEVSKAYYGKIEKSDQYYRVPSSKEFNLYLSLQIPDLPNQSKNVALELVDNSGTQFVRLDGSHHIWSKFHESFGNADYLAGPSSQIFLPPGVYQIKISGEENTKYVLVVGQKEEFPPSEILNALYLVPKINIEFFGMNVFQSMLNVFGFMIIGIIAVIGFVCLIVIRRVRRKAKSKA
jgi:hypothetical protein